MYKNLKAKLFESEIDTPFFIEFPCFLLYMIIVIFIIITTDTYIKTLPFFMEVVFFIVVIIVPIVFCFVLYALINYFCVNIYLKNKSKRNKKEMVYFSSTLNDLSNDYSDFVKNHITIPKFLKGITIKLPYEYVEQFFMEIQNNKNLIWINNELSMGRVDFEKDGKELYEKFKEKELEIYQTILNNVLKDYDGFFESEVGISYKNSNKDNYTFFKDIMEKDLIIEKERKKDYLNHSENRLREMI